MIKSSMSPPSHNLEPSIRDGAVQRTLASFGQSQTRLTPEILLSLRPELWQSFQNGSGNKGMTMPPYWALEWPGGQALARYILDHPEVVERRTVADWGAGCGVVAIAAALAGARLVRAIDRDPNSVAAIRRNAGLNRVARRVLATKAELPALLNGDHEVILAADLWYDRFDSMRITQALRSVVKSGSLVLLGDTDRAFTPRAGLKVLSRYLVPTNQGVERMELTNAFVAQLAGAAEAHI